MFFIYIIILSLPLYLVRFSVFGIKTNILDILLVFFVSTRFIDGIYFKKNDLKSFAYNIYKDAKKFLVPIAIIVIGLILSTLKSENVYVGAGIIKSWFVLPILLFLGSVSIVDSDEKKKGILKVWFLGGCIVALVSLGYYFAGIVMYDGRLSGLFDSPNSLAMFLIPSFIIGAWLSFWESDKIARLAYVLGLVLVGFAVLTTRSLGGFAAMFLAFIFLISQSHKIKENKKYVVLIVVFLACSTAYLFYIHDFGDRSSLASRMMIWKSAIKILSDNYILGIGPGIFQEKYLLYQKYFTPYLEWAAPHPHNILLAFWLQSGIMGLIGFLWLMAEFFKNIWKNKNDKIVLLCGSLMIYYLAHGLIDVTYWRNDLAIMFWMTVLLAIKK